MNSVQKSNLQSPELKRTFKFKIKNQSKLQTFNQQYITNNFLHVPGKINFHELLSIPLEKQIQRQNSLKQNQTFCLNFQSDLTQRESKKYSSRIIFNKLGYRNSRLLNGKNLTTQKGPRNKNNHENSQFRETNQAATTMYFRPIGKIVKNQEIEHNERRSFQINRIIRNKQNQKLQIGVSVCKDKLMMFLDIRKQEKIERKSKCGLQSGLNSHRQMKKISMGENLIQKFQDSKSYRQSRRNYREDSVMLNLKKEKQEIKQTQDIIFPSQLSPWFLMQNGQDL